MDLGETNTLRDIVLFAIARQQHCLTLLLLVVEIVSLIWMEQNAMAFRDRWAMAPTILIWHWVTSNLEAILIRITNLRISNTLSRDINLIRGCLTTPW